jgi:cellulose biosynthesis protein BcsQ
MVGGDRLLYDALREIPAYPSYSYVVIDCPPSRERLTLNALSAATEVIVPIQAGRWAMDGFSHLLNTIDLVRDRLNAQLRISGIVLTFYDSRTTFSREVHTTLKRPVRAQAVQGCHQNYCKTQRGGICFCHGLAIRAQL